MKKTVLKLKSDTLNEVLLTNNNLLTKKHEYAGTFNFGGKTCSKNSCFKVSFGVKSVKGNKCYSDIPNAKINFHTHPVICYRETESIWGWPSGMDMKAVIKLKDNDYHIIFALEGTYVINVPKLVKDNISIRDLDTIGEYFSMTHEFRSIDNYETHGEKFKQMYNLKYKTNHPLEIWLKLANDYKVKINNRLVRVFFITFIPNISFQYIHEPEDVFDIIKSLNSKNINNFVNCPETINLKSS